ncbi:FAD-dependent oxidoreductase [Bacillota bacterium]
MEQFYQQFSTCLQKELPFCQASCPFHLDIIDFIEKTGRGAYDAAYKTYRNAVTFPAIVSALCPEPCKALCPMGQEANGGNAIELRGLERTVVAEAKNKDPIFYNVPKKKQRAAVIGAGVSGLACALRLAAKKYDVEVFEATNKLGGQLWNIADGSPEVGGLTPDIFLEDFQLQLKEEAITIHYNHRVNNLTELTEKGFDAIYVATGSVGEDFGVTDTDSPLSMGDAVCFAGGSLTGKSTIEALADGISMSLAIETFFKTGKAQYPGDNRITRVLVDPSKMEYKAGPGLNEAGSISTEDTQEEAGRCLRCRCDSCKIYCDLVAYTGKWPLRIKDEVQATMHQGQADVKPQPAKRLINICTHCGLCDDVCPANINMDSMFLEARKNLHRLNRMPWAFHDFWLKDMEFADGKLASIVRTSPGTDKSDYAFFPGCQLGASEPRYVTDAYRWLLGKAPTMALFLKCCGTPVKWAGNEEKHGETINQLRRDWEGLGKPKLVVACPNCMNNICEFLPEVQIISLYEFMEEKGGLMPAMKGESEVWSVFDPCTAVGKDGLRQTIRTVTEKAGFQLEALPIQEDHTSCCSYGGQVSVANPEFADFVIEKRITESENPYVTYCINCRDSFLSKGKRTLHILDILFGDEGSRGHASLPTVTERRENRVLLKKTLLKDIWTEEMMDDRVKSRIRLSINPELTTKLDRERILLEEIIETIEFCEKTGRKIEIGNCGSFSGYHRIGYMTYWVEYKGEGDTFELLNAYSHRMRIDLEAVWNGKRVDTEV